MNTTECEFVQGLQLSRSFFDGVVSPILQRSFPELRCAAALIGDGSEVLGFDTEMSADHDWGPRLQLFLQLEEFAAAAPKLIEILDQEVPHSWEGYETGFVDPDRFMGTDLSACRCGSNRHGVELFSLQSFFERHLAVDVLSPIPAEAWLGFPEQILLAMNSGAVFFDPRHDLKKIRAALSYYPRDVWLHLLACQWTRISQEQPFVGRAGAVGDELGSILIAIRLVQDMMRLCFLMERQYAPYSKWFGSAFNRLACSRQLASLFGAVRRAETWKDRERALCSCYEALGRLHNSIGITTEVPVRLEDFHNRPFKVVNADEFITAIRSEIADQRIRSWPVCGSINQISDNTDILCSPLRSKSIIQSLYSACSDK